MKAADADHVVARAVGAAAAAVRPEATDTSFLEKRLAATLASELERLLPRRQILVNKKVPNLVFPDWDPQPGSLDVAVTKRGRLQLALELKLDDVDQTM